MTATKQEMVREFMEKHGFPTKLLQRLRDGEVPPVLLQSTGLVRMRLMLEELAELGEAWAREDVVDVIDALADLLYTVYGTAETIGVDADAAFDEVHRSNMTKACDGKLKPAKGDGYSPPDFTSILQGAKRSL